MEVTVKRIALILVGLGVLALGTTYALSIRGAERQDCPGKIICPITGELICSDQCPLEDGAGHTLRPPVQKTSVPAGETALAGGDPSDSDMIICPITGEPIEADRCPLRGDGAGEAGSVPPCCSGSER
jgi:hypothetical protein